MTCGPSPRLGPSLIGEGVIAATDSGKSSALPRTELVRGHQRSKKHPAGHAKSVCCLAETKMAARNGCLAAGSLKYASFPELRKKKKNQTPIAGCFLAQACAQGQGLRHLHGGFFRPCGKPSLRSPALSKPLERGSALSAPLDAESPRCTLCPCPCYAPFALTHSAICDPRFLLVLPLPCVLWSVFFFFFFLSLRGENKKP